jgi:hypothetical protein
MTKKSNTKSAKQQIGSGFVSRITAMEAEEFFQRLGGCAEWNNAEKRRQEKLREITRLLSAVLGTDVDPEQEAMNAIKMWDETTGMEDAPRELRTPFELLLGDYRNICEEILRIQEDLSRPR